MDDTADVPPFFICYEFYGGIAVHTEHDERAVAATISFALALGARHFLI